jgi:hypothetical protein
MKTETYIDTEVKKLDTSSDHFIFQLRDNLGNKTNYLNLTHHQLEKLTHILKTD